MSEESYNANWQRTAQDLRLVFAWLFVVMGSGFAIIGFAMGAWTMLFASTALRTEGVVIDLVGNERREALSPIVRYQVDARDYEHRSDVSSNFYAVGDRVTVLYQPGNPGLSQIDTFVDRWLFPLALGGGGLLFAGIGLAIVIANRRHVHADSRDRIPPVATR